MYDSTPAMLVVADHADMVDVNNNSDDQDDIWLEASLQSNLGIITSSSSSSSSASMAATNGDIDSTDTVVSTIFDVPTIGLANLTALFADERLMNITRFYRQNHRPDYARNVTVLSAYAIIFLISLFGNVMVCYIIAHNRKMHNFTNYFIANLAASDLLMTMINVPFGVARMLLDDWPFGDFLCKCLPFIQSTSVYVSTITMCIISVDRYCVVIHPFGARITNWLPLGAVLALIWFISCALSIPFAYHNRVVTMNIVFQVFERCRAVYPSANYSKMLSLYAALTQYAIPLAIASVAYVRIAFGIKHRSKLGAKTPEQLQRILRTNRQTIKMLVLVLVVFAICWLPLHLFCLYRDFVDASAFSTRAFLFVHWIGMSSVSYNAFIYSARNKHFRDGMKTILRQV